MHRVISNFRLLPPGDDQSGPLKPSVDPEICPEAVNEFLLAVYVAVEKLRQFGFSDEDFGGPIKLVVRKEGQRANGRYKPKTNVSIIYHPTVRGPQDWPWTIIHEVVHRLWVKHLNKEDKDLWGVVCDAVGKPIDSSAADALTRVVKNNPDKSALWFFFKTHFGDDLGLFRKWLTTKTTSASFPSAYASADPSEAFAEVAADIILGRGRAGREIRRSGSMVRKVFLSLVEKLRNKELSESLQIEHYAMQDKDEYFLQLQVDFYYLRWKIGDWVRKRLSGKDVLKLEDRPHATLYYGADKRDLPQIREIISGHGRSLRMMLGPLNVFEHEDKDVLYFELIGDPLPTLHAKIKKLPNTRPPTYPDYAPHLTVAYMKKGSARKFIGTSPLRMIISARRVTVIDSAGIEQMIPAKPIEELTREPLLLAGP